MRLSNKVILTLGAVWFVFLALSYVGTYLYLMKSIYNLETKEIINDISRIHQAINQRIYALGTFTTDWAHWNDAYDYIEGNNPQFVPNNLDLVALQNSNINLLIYLNTKDEILIGLFADLANKKLISFPQGLEKYIYKGSPFLYNKNVEESNRGLILVDSGIMLIASAGVSYTDKNKPMNGTFIAGTMFTSNILRQIKETTNFPLILYVPKSIILSKIKYVYDEAKKNNDRYIYFKNDKMAYVYTILRDINNNPIGMIRVDIYRSVYQTGNETIRYYLGIYLLSGFILGIVILYLLRVLVLNRLEYLHDQIRDIRNKHDYGLQIDLQGNDELTLLAKQFNDLMKTIQDSHEKLGRQIKELSDSEERLEKANNQLTVEINERKQAESKVSSLHEKLIMAARRAGMADIASGILHNVGNILNSITTTTTLAREHTLKSRAVKLKELNELFEKNKNNLSQFLTTDSKGQKILGYLSILASEWERENNYILKEITSLDKNIDHIKNVISMQQSLSTIVSMNEEVKLESLIEDAIVINFNLYKNNKIEIVREYNFTGKIVIDRVKLLHVMVNIIKNSLDSLNESDNNPKKMVIRTKNKDSTYFIIEIEDNGVGILSENLTKIFSYGFTTKKNGHGFGLHTSATFVNEMKGSLSAESKGINQGAKFAVILPIEPIKNTTIKKSKPTMQTNL